MWGLDIREFAFRLSNFAQFNLQVTSYKFTQNALIGLVTSSSYIITVIYIIHPLLLKEITGSNGFRGKRIN